MGKKDKHRKTAQNLNYKSANRREKSHCRRIMKHLDRYGYDKVAVEGLIAYAGKAGATTVAKARTFLHSKGFSGY